MEKNNILKRKIIIGAGIVLAAGVVLFWYIQHSKTAAVTATASQSVGTRQSAGGASEKVQAIKQEVQKTVDAKNAQSEEEAKAAAEAEEAAKKAEEEAAKTGSGKKVAIDPGHQGWNVNMSALEPNAPGSSEMKAKCTSGTSGNYSGLAEYQLNLDISLKLRTELESRGYEVLLTREDNDAAISNAERTQLSNEWGSDIYVRIHANSSENTSTQGALTLIPSSSNPYVGSQYSASRALAESILTSYCSATGFSNRGIQENDTMTGINWSTKPVVIVEMGFMSNQNDDLLMADTAFQEIMVQGLAEGIDNYFNNQ